MFARSVTFRVAFAAVGVQTPSEQIIFFVCLSDSTTAAFAWDAKMAAGLEKAQDKDDSWSGQHCITGKTFCTSAALLVLMADRTQFPPEVLVKAAPKSWFPWSDR